MRGRAGEGPNPSPPAAHVVAAGLLRLPCGEEPAEPSDGVEVLRGAVGGRHASACRFLCEFARCGVAAGVSVTEDAVSTKPRRTCSLRMSPCPSSLYSSQLRHARFSRAVVCGSTAAASNSCVREGGRLSVNVTDKLPERSGAAGAGALTYGGWSFAENRSAEASTPHLGVVDKVEEPAELVLDGSVHNHADVRRRPGKGTGSTHVAAASASDSVRCVVSYVQPPLSSAAAGGTGGKSANRLTSGGALQALPAPPLRCVQRNAIKLARSQRGEPARGRRREP